MKLGEGFQPRNLCGLLENMPTMAMQSCHPVIAAISSTRDA